MADDDVLDEVRSLRSERNSARAVIAALSSQDEGRQTRIRELLLTVDQLWFERDAAYATIAKARTALWHGGYRIDSAAAVIAYDILAQSPADALAEHDRAVKAEALEEAAYATRPKYRAVNMTGATSGIFEVNDALHRAADRLDHRAARCRKGI